MLNINLVPETIKHELKLKNISGSINKIIFILLCFVILTTASLYFTIFYLQNYYSEKLILSTNVDKKTEPYTQELLSINNSLVFIANVQKDHIKWTNLFYSLGQTINNDLSFNTISIDKKGNSVSISGHANTRDSLLLFKDKIENNPYLSNIVFPLKTLFEKENIDFSINATISSYEFSKL